MEKYRAGGASPLRLWAASFQSIEADVAVVCVRKTSRNDSSSDQG